MTGKNKAKLDEKGRLFVPSKFRGELGELFYVTVGVNGGHRCLAAYPAAEWQRLSDNYNALSIAEKSGATSLIFINAAECVPDKQYRITLPSFLLKYAGIERDAMVVGKAGQAEIWNTEEFEAFELENLTPEKLLASLGAIGL